MFKDLKLSEDGKLNHAALILLAKKEAIERFFAQSETIWEFRNIVSQIYFDIREIITDPLFVAIDKIWQLINQPTLNRKHPIHLGAYIFDLFDLMKKLPGKQF